MKSSLGVVYKRRESILKYLKEHKSAMVQDLATILEVSEITIRRDLQIFEDDGIVERFYGGAKLVDENIQTRAETIDSINTRSDQIGNIEIKDKIAHYASKMIHENDTIFVNSGSTALLLLNYLSDKHVTIITNNGKAITQPKPKVADLVLSGGEIFEKKQSLVGDFALSTFSKVSANICFLGIGGIDEKGVTTYVLSETAVNRTILERTNGSRVIIAEGYKVGRQNNFITSDLALITHIITDKTACKKTVQTLRDEGIEVIIIDETQDED